MNELKAARIISLAKELITFVERREEDAKVMQRFAESTVKLTFEEDKAYVKKLLVAIEETLDQ